ncbi:MAG: phosphoribosylamine--glycine ligase, partial [Bacteroidetes bacterium]|nr:phosphoribosylamine--glycine ligase [Bacteroidota bacterium]
MKVLLIGSGGREHAIASKLAQSKRLSKLWIAPGNAGTLLCGENIPLKADDFEGIAGFIEKESVDVLVVGPEDPLVNGIREFIESRESCKACIIVGPGREGAQLEGSKDFSKQFMARHSIPTARYQSFTGTQLNNAKAFLRQMQAPYVLKASGLAAGKGVVISASLDEADRELEEMLGGKFGAAGDTVVIEEYMHGIECSVFVLSDGKNYLILPEAKDYKRIGEGDTGLNTGGMGAVSPVPFCDALFMEKVRSRIVEPTMKGLRSENISYLGFIFIGLMNVGGDPFVVEYNCRMGDPETEVVMPRIENDLIDLFEALGKQELDQHEIKCSQQTAVTVVTVSGGYPGNYEKGKEISGLDQIKHGSVFHAGTALSGSKIITSGGRVLAFTSMGSNLQEALNQSYDNISKICYEGIYFRKDIGKDLL